LLLLFLPPLVIYRTTVLTITYAAALFHFDVLLIVW